MLEYFDKMYSDGYYRDSYDPSNLLWELGLNWWDWFGGHLDKDGLLQPDRAEVILNEVLSRRYLLESMADEEMRADFEEKFEDFTRFLRTAINAGEAIGCSIY